jgi:hypothetical protein
VVSTRYVLNFFHAKDENEVTMGTARSFDQRPSQPSARENRQASRKQPVANETRLALTGHNRSFTKKNAAAGLL